MKFLVKNLCMYTSQELCVFLNKGYTSEENNIETR
jgi:hypothetical protein